jgi:hypothetical protein
MRRTAAEVVELLRPGAQTESIWHIQLEVPVSTMPAPLAAVS